MKRPICIKKVIAPILAIFLVAITLSLTFLIGGLPSHAAPPNPATTATFLPDPADPHKLVITIEHADAGDHFVPLVRKIKDDGTTELVNVAGTGAAAGPNDVSSDQPANNGGREGNGNITLTFSDNGSYTTHIIGSNAVGNLTNVGPSNLVEQAWKADVRLTLQAGRPLENYNVDGTAIHQWAPNFNPVSTEAKKAYWRAAIWFAHHKDKHDAARLHATIDQLRTEQANELLWEADGVPDLERLTRARAAQQSISLDDVNQVCGINPGGRGRTTPFVRGGTANTLNAGFLERIGVLNPPPIYTPVSMPAPGAGQLVVKAGGATLVDRDHTSNKFAVVGSYSFTLHGAIPQNVNYFLENGILKIQWRFAGDKPAGGWATLNPTCEVKQLGIAKGVGLVAVDEATATFEWTSDNYDPELEGNISLRDPNNAANDQVVNVATMLGPTPAIPAAPAPPPARQARPLRFNFNNQNLVIDYEITGQAPGAGWAAWNPICAVIQGGKSLPVSGVINDNNGNFHWTVAGWDPHIATDVSAQLTGSPNLTQHLAINPIARGPLAAREPTYRFENNKLEIHWEFTGEEPGGGWASLNPTCQAFERGTALTCGPVVRDGAGHFSWVLDNWNPALETRVNTTVAGRPALTRNLVIRPLMVEVPIEPNKPVYALNGTDLHVVCCYTGTPPKGGWNTLQPKCIVRQGSVQRHAIGINNGGSQFTWDFDRYDPSKAGTVIVSTDAAGHRPKRIDIPPHRPAPALVPPPIIPPAPGLPYVPPIESSSSSSSSWWYSYPSSASSSTEPLVENENPKAEVPEEKTESEPLRYFGFWRDYLLIAGKWELHALGVHTAYVEYRFFEILPDGSEMPLGQCSANNVCELDATPGPHQYGVDMRNPASGDVIRKMFDPLDYPKL